MPITYPPSPYTVDSAAPPPAPAVPSSQFTAAEGAEVLAMHAGAVTRNKGALTLALSGTEALTTATIGGLTLDQYTTLVVDWGDGYSEQVRTLTPTHSYRTYGRFNVKVFVFVSGYSKNSIGATATYLDPRASA